LVIMYIKYIGNTTALIVVFIFKTKQNNKIRFAMFICQHIFTTYLNMQSFNLHYETLFVYNNTIRTINKKEINNEIYNSQYQIYMRFTSTCFMQNI